MRKGKERFCFLFQNVLQLPAGPLVNLRSAACWSVEQRSRRPVEGHLVQVTNLTKVGDSFPRSQLWAPEPSGDDAKVILPSRNIMGIFQ